MWKIKFHSFDFCCFCYWLLFPKTKKIKQKNWVFGFYCIREIIDSQIQSFHSVIYINISRPWCLFKSAPPPPLTRVLTYNITFIKSHNLFFFYNDHGCNNNTVTLNLSYNWPLSPLLLPISYYFCQNRKWPNLVYIDIDIQIYFKKIYLPILDRHFQSPKPYFLIYLGNII